MDLSKAFYTLNHEFFIAKIHAHEFGKEFLMPILSYSSNRWQRTKINTSLSSWTELRCATRVSSWSIVIQHLFK